MAAGALFGVRVASAASAAPEGVADDAAASRSKAGFFRMALGPSMLFGRVDDTVPETWWHIGAGASLDLSVGARLSNTVVLGASLNATVLPYLHGVVGEDHYPSDVDFKTSLLTLVGPFVDVELQRFSSRSLHLEAGLSLAVLSLGAATANYPMPATNLFGGAGSLGLRWETSCSKRWCLGVGGRLAMGRVVAENVQSISTDAACGFRGEWFVAPAFLVSGVYR